MQNYTFALRSYPNFRDNPYLDNRLRKLMAPHLLPLNHPLKPKLDALFSSSRVTESEESLLAAGFSIIASMPGSFVIVARHPELRGQVLKLYLDNEMRTKDGIPNSEWLIRRCIGAKIIRDIIIKKKFKTLTIPDKWLYILPRIPLSQGPRPQPVLVIETDMELYNEAESLTAWKTQITPEHLNELYAILKHGYGTIRVAENIPFTKHGTFAFTDTEYPQRKLKLRKVKPYLSEEMQIYWDTLAK
ncbi:MAG: hypothetical protein K2P51_05310 [Rhabdochlamydiaceae bacterium]|nr:hypothetical protein [Rhabdochlamydiaceae bacterium]